MSKYIISKINLWINLWITNIFMGIDLCITILDKPFMLLYNYNMNNKKNALAHKIEAGFLIINLLGVLAIALLAFYL